jgi:nucleoid DNA-binding protein
MNKAQFASILSSKLKIRRKQALKYIDSFFNSIYEILKKDGSITIRGFGTFKVITRKERKIINPKTKKFFNVAPKKIITFKAYKKLKDNIK